MHTYLQGPRRPVIYIIIILIVVLAIFRSQSVFSLRHGWAGVSAAHSRVG